jgi:hypothetical protein
LGGDASNQGAPIYVAREKRRRGESERGYLTRLGLLLPGERA